MSRRTRRWVRALATGVVGTLALTGCMKMAYDIELKPDGVGSVSMIMAVSDEFAEQNDMTPDELWDTMGQEMESDAPEGATSEPYAEDGYTGMRYTLEDAPIEDLFRSGGTSETQDGSGATEELSVVQDGDDYVLTGVMDLTGDEAVDPEATDEFTRAFLDTFVVEVSVTFPGQVSDHNGSLEGNTVTWTPAYGEITEMNARGSAIAGGSSDGAQSKEGRSDGSESGADDATSDSAEESSAGFPWWILAVAVVVLLLVIGGVVLLATRKSKPADLAATPPAAYPVQAGPPQPQMYETQPIATPPAPFAAPPAPAAVPPAPPAPATPPAPPAPAAPPPPPTDDDPHA